jgi:hypothetical protein
MILGLIAFPAIDDDEGNHQEQVGELIKQTAASIDNLALKMLFVTIQQNNLEVCIEYAINRSVRLTIHSFSVASTYLSIAEISSKMPQQWYIFTWIVRDVSAQINKGGLDLQDCTLVCTLLF